MSSSKKGGEGHIYFQPGHMEASSRSVASASATEPDGHKYYQPGVSRQASTSKAKGSAMHEPEGQHKYYQPGVTSSSTTAQAGTGPTGPRARPGRAKATTGGQQTLLQQCYEMSPRYAPEQNAPGTGVGYNQLVRESGSGDKGPGPSPSPGAPTPLLSETEKLMYAKLNPSKTDSQLNVYSNSKPSSERPNEYDTVGLSPSPSSTMAGKGSGSRVRGVLPVWCGAQLDVHKTLVLSAALLALLVSLVCVLVVIGVSVGAAGKGEGEGEEGCGAACLASLQALQDQVYQMQRTLNSTLADLQHLSVDLQALATGNCTRKVVSTCTVVAGVGVCETDRYNAMSGYSCAVTSAVSEQAAFNPILTTPVVEGSWVKCLCYVRSPEDIQDSDNIRCSLIVTLCPK